MIYLHQTRVVLLHVKWALYQKIFPKTKLVEKLYAMISHIRFHQNLKMAYKMYKQMLIYDLM
jgi:hypothetical protein